MEIDIVVQGKADYPQLPLGKPILDFSQIEKMTFVLVEAGMTSGEPSVIIAVEHPAFIAFPKSVIVQTSLDKLLMAASALASAAETRFGWERPEGHATLMPPSREARRGLLESIKKELEEWGEIDGSSQDT